MSQPDSGAAATSRDRPTRFLSDQTGRFHQYIEAAKRYVSSLGTEGAAWLYQKPFDRNRGHGPFFQDMYAALNIVKAMALPQGARVLEVGCGPGWLTEMLLLLGYSVDAVEPAGDLVRIAEARIASLKQHNHFDATGRIRFHAVPVEELALEASSFDGVLFFAALHHVVDEKLTLRTCFDLLKPGGVMGVYEGAWHPDFKDLEAALEEEMRAHGTLENPFTMEYMDDCLREAGFGGIRRYISIDGYVQTWAVDMPMRVALPCPPEALNNLTARKPPRPGSPDWGAEIRVLDSEASDGRIRLKVEITNTGTAEMPGGGAYPGAVTVSVYRGTIGGDDFREGFPRSALPRTLAPLESAVVGLDTAIPADAPRDGWVVGLICEHRSWLANEGVMTASVA